MITIDNIRWNVVISVFCLINLYASMAVGQVPEAGQANYVRHRVMLDSAGTSSVTSVNYYDGLGRRQETVVVGCSPSGADLVSFSAYDRAGRVTRQYNPVPNAGMGGFVAEQDVLLLGRSAYGDQSPYETIQHEQSPTGGVVAVTGAGQAWHAADKAVTTARLTNDPGDDLLDCRMFDVTATRDCTDTVVTVTPRGKYPKGRLFVTVTVDEDGHTVYTFTDFDGRTVLTRAVSGNTRFDTYYIYDVCGNLTAVLPPKASATVGAGETLTSASSKLYGLAYFYLYDWRNRCRGRKLPGCAWQLMANDLGDRTVLIQDGNLRKQGKSRFVLSDAFGRECVTGIADTTLSLAGCTTGKSGTVRRTGQQGTLGGYEMCDSSFTLSVNRLLTVTYYDDYSFLNGYSGGGALAYQERQGYDRRYVNGDHADVSAKGWQTGRAVSVLGSDSVLLSASYYDIHGNVIQRHEKNHLGGFEHYYCHLTFTGKPLAVRHEHTTADTTLVETLAYTYDSMERLLTVSLTRGDNGTPLLLETITYDALGRVAERKRLNNALSTAYGYNVRDWITGVDCQGVFQQQMTYAPSRYNGDIGVMAWNDGNGGTSCHSYTYQYDGLDRLTAAAYQGQGINAGADYSTAYTYDLNGNVTNLSRYGVKQLIVTGDTTVVSYGLIDGLTCTLNGNRLTKVNDSEADLTYSGAMEFRDGANSSKEYSWDANGNMIKDLNRGVRKITYNVLNLPAEITFSDKHIIGITYAADGRKLAMAYKLNQVMLGGGGGLLSEPEPSGGEYGTDILPFDPSGPLPPSDSVINTFSKVITLYTINYCDNHVYRNRVLKRTLLPTGYIANDSVFAYVTDYQGNVRAVVREDGTVVERNSYYPYGVLMTMAGSSSVQPLKYGAKELERENGLDWYDSRARWYDPLTVTTPTLDPLLEKYFPLSPHLWCAGNPIRNIDEDGDSIAVLNLGGVIGHSALLIQDENNKWAYFSFNGNNLYNKTGGMIGGKPYHDLGTQKFDSPQAFLNSDYNSEGSSEQIFNDTRSNYEFKEAYILPTTKSQDKIISKKFKQIANNENYSLFNVNCITTVERSLEDAHIKTANPQSIKKHVPSNFKLGESGFDIIQSNRSIHPETGFNNIIKLNPYGSHIFKQH